MQTALNGQQGAFQMLLQNGADPSLKDNGGFNLLYYPAEGGNTSIINELLSLGLDIDSRRNNGVTPLMTAAMEDKKMPFRFCYKRVLIHLWNTTVGLVYPFFLNGRCRENLIIVTVNRCHRPLVILVALRPASLTHKNPQRRKIFHGMRPVGRKDRSNRSIWTCVFVEISRPFA